MNLRIGDVVEVHLPHVGAALAKVVWGREDIFGCRFQHEISKAAVSASLLRSDPSLPQQPSAIELKEPQSTDAAAARVKIPRYAGRGVMGAAAVLLLAAALGSIALAWGMVALAASATAIGLVALLVRWGFWILDNTYEL